jgi:DNA polymerase-3 subunit delta
LKEEQLLNELKQGVIRRIYYLHGKETFLVETYAKRIMEKALAGDEPDALNCVKFSGNPDINALADSIETLPVFAEKKIVMLNDLDTEKLDAASLEDLLKILSNADDSVCVIIHMTGIHPDLKKAKTKKLISCFENINKKHSEKAGILNFEKMNEVKISELIVKRAARKGCKISRDNAAHLARLCLRNLTLIAAETDKLCAYADYKGEITRKSIDTLTARQLDSGVFALAAEITSKRGANAMRLLDELIEQGNPPVVIMSSLSMTFIDFYRAKIGSSGGKTAQQIVKDFGYAPNRAWAVGKAMSAVSRLTAEKIRGCVGVLCDADYGLKSSPIGDRVIMERAIARLLTLC